LNPELRGTLISLILSLDDLHNAISGCINEDLAKAIVSYLTRRINDENYIKRAGLNLLLYQRNKLVQRKLHEFVEILKVLSSLPKEDYALIKVKPFITNIWNDVDVFVVTKDAIKQVLSLLKTQNKVEEVTSKGRKGITIYLKNNKIQIDVYTFIGWRGLKYVDLPGNNFEEACIQGGHIHICNVSTLPLCTDLLIQMLHFIADSKTSLSDALKLLCTLHHCRGYLSNQGLQGAKILLNIEYLIRRTTHLILINAEKIVKDGVITIPPEPWAKTQLMLSNLKLRNRDVMSYYYEIRDLGARILVHRGC
jgi:hypothetical protein